MINLEDLQKELRCQLVVKKYVLEFDDSNIKNNLEITYTPIGDLGFFDIQRILSKRVKLPISQRFTKPLQLINWIQLWKVYHKKNNGLTNPESLGLLNTLGELILQNPEKKFQQLSREFLEKLQEIDLLNKMTPESLLMLGITDTLKKSSKFGL